MIILLMKNGIDIMEKSISFYVTEKCNAACPSCFNSNFREVREMTVAKFSLLCDYFSEKGYTLLKIMGGEPTVHSCFEKIYNVAQKKFSKVNLFTNGMSDILLTVVPRNEDSIIYNFDFLGRYPESHFLIGKKGIRGFELQIRKDSNPSYIIDQIKYIWSLLGAAAIFNLTLDCMTNIFVEKDKVIGIYRKVWDYCVENKIAISQDHIVPLCYSLGTKFPRVSRFAKCNCKDAGIVDAAFNLRFCNQHPQILINLFSGNKIIPYEILVNHLKAQYMRNQLKALDKICIECTFYGEYCDGGCFIENDRISKDDILNNTFFPTL